MLRANTADLAAAGLGGPARVWSRWLPPVLVFLASQALLALTAYWSGFDWLSTGSRIRWDGGIYLDIAQTGYYAAPCAEINPGMVVAEQDATCGNAAWYPLFPYLVLGLHTITGLGLAGTSVLVAEASTLGMLFMVWRLLDTGTTTVKLACLAVVATLPSGVYFHATFPMSLTVLLALATFALLVRGRWALAGLTAGLAATAYPLGVLLAPTALVFLLAGAAKPDRWAGRTLAKAAYVGGMTGGGALAVFGLLQLTTGRYDAGLQIQRNYGNGVHNPLASFLTVLDQHPLAVDAQMLFVVCLAVVALVALRKAAVRGVATPLDWALATVYGPLVVIVPLIIGPNQAQYRSHTLLVPLVLVLRHLRPAPVAAIATAAVPIAVALASMFVSGELV